MDQTLQFKNAEKFQRLLDKIEPLFNGGNLPKNLDPISFAEWVPSLILSEFSHSPEGETLSFRYFGGVAADFYGELQGQAFSKASATADQARWYSHAEKVRDHRRPIRLSSEGNKLKKGKLDIESLLVPAASNGSDVDRIYCFGDYLTRT
jgi:hypothetical protein